MAVAHGGKAQSLAYTNGTSITFAYIKSYRFWNGKDLIEWFDNDNPTPSQILDTDRSFIEIETADITNYYTEDVGDLCTSVVLTFLSGGASKTFTLSSAYITEKSEISKDNSNNEPPTFTIRFTIGQSADGADPTATYGAPS